MSPTISVYLPIQLAKLSWALQIFSFRKHFTAEPKYT